MTVEAVVALGGIGPDDVMVQLYYGPLDADGQLNAGESITMEQIERLDDNKVRYRAPMPCRDSGMVGYTLRVMPHNKLLADPLSLGLMRWA